MNMEIHGLTQIENAKDRTLQLYMKLLNRDAQPKNFQRDIWKVLFSMRRRIISALKDNTGLIQPNCEEDGILQFYCHEMGGGNPDLYIVYPTKQSLIDGVNWKEISSNFFSSGDALEEVFEEMFGDEYYENNSEAEAVCWKYCNMIYVDSIPDWAASYLYLDPNIDNMRSIVSYKFNENIDCAKGFWGDDKTDSPISAKPIVANPFNGMPVINDISYQERLKIISNINNQAFSVGELADMIAASS